MGVRMGSETVATFDELIDEKRRGGKRRRHLLRYLTNHPNKTAYEIAKATYRNAMASFKITKIHLKKFVNLGVLESKTVDGITRYSFTDQGRMMCKARGIDLPAGRAEKIIAGLNRYVREPLTNEDIKTLRAVLTDDVVDCMGEIAKNFARVKSVDFWPKIEPIPKELKEHFGPWIEYEKKLDAENIKKRKLEVIERPELPRVFVMAMAVLRWEYRFKNEQPKYLDYQEKVFGDLLRKKVQDKKTPKNVAKKELERFYLKREFERPWAYTSIFVENDFDKISCGYYLVKRDRKLADKFIALDKWLVDSFFKKCDPLIYDYVIRIGKELERQLGEYGQMWALHKLYVMNRKEKPKVE